MTLITVVHSPSPDAPPRTALTLTVKDDAEAERIFAILADGGQVHMPLMPSFFSSKFGMVADRFGVNWMVIVAA